MKKELNASSAVSARPTILDVAAACGVSPATVSNALANKPHVKASTKALVLQKVAELGYRASTTARSLRMGRSWSVGLVLADIANPFTPDIVRGVEEGVWAQRSNLILCNTDFQSDRKMAYVRSLLDKHVEGLIFLSQTFTAQEIQSLNLDTMPIVTINRICEALLSDHVGLDNASGVRMAMDYLAGLGHRRISFVKGLTESSSAKDRYAAYLEAVRQHGLDSDPALVEQGDYSMELGSIAVRQMIASGARPTAVFACNDLMAIGVLGAMRELGLAVPEDMSVVGFDDIYLSNHPLVNLTTVHHPKRESGAAAARLLLRRISEAPGAPPAFRHLEPFADRPWLHRSSQRPDTGGAAPIPPKKRIPKT
jgi:LacI family transcriptional regulator